MLRDARSARFEMIFSGRFLVLLGFALAVLSEVSCGGTIVVNPRPEPPPPISEDTGGNDIVLPIVTPPPPPPPLFFPSKDSSRPLSGNHYGAADNQALFRLTITPAGRFTLFAQVGGRTIRRSGRASEQPFALRGAGEGELTATVRLEQQPVLAARLAVKIGESPTQAVALYTRRELGSLAASRFHLLMDVSQDTPELAAVNGVNSEAIVPHGRSFAVLLKEAGGMVSLVGKDPAGKPWNCWSFVGPDSTIPVLAKQISGSLQAEADGTLTGSLNWATATSAAWTIDVEGSPFVRPEVGNNVFGQPSTQVKIAADSEPESSDSATCDGRGKIRWSTGTAIHGRLEANPKNGTLKGSLRSRSTGRAGRVSGLFIPHRNLLIGFAGTESFEVRAE
jgi:hypothetical protein